MKKKIRYRVGDIVTIPLPNKSYAYGKIFHDSTIGIYKLVTKTIEPVEKVMAREIAFYAGFFDTKILNGDWSIIGSQPFENDEAAWPPPKYIQDILNPEKYRIYDKGTMRPATETEIQGLEKAIMYKPESLESKIMTELLKDQESRVSPPDKSGKVYSRGQSIRP